VLREDGSLVLVWNMRDLGDPVQRGVEELRQGSRAQHPRLAEERVDCHVGRRDERAGVG